MSSKKKPKFKKRGSINVDELFRKRVDLKYLQMKFSIERAFPNVDERVKYIDSLIDKLGEDL